jgi:hypothetical protein
MLSRRTRRSLALLALHAGVSRVPGPASISGFPCLACVTGLACLSSLSGHALSSRLPLVSLLSGLSRLACLSNLTLRSGWSRDRRWCWIHVTARDQKHQKD